MAWQATRSTNWESSRCSARLPTLMRFVQTTSQPAARTSQASLSVSSLSICYSIYISQIVQQLAHLCSVERRSIQYTNSNRNEMCTFLKAHFHFRFARPTSRKSTLLSFFAYGILWRYVGKRSDPRLKAEVEIRTRLKLEIYFRLSRKQ